MPIWNREKLREAAMQKSGDPLQAEETVFQTNGNSKRHRGHATVWVCLRKSRDVMVAKAE